MQQQQQNFLKSAQPANDVSNTKSILQNQHSTESNETSRGTSQVVTATEQSLSEIYETMQNQLLAAATFSSPSFVSLNFGGTTALVSPQSTNPASLVNTSVKQSTAVSAQLGTIHDSQPSHSSDKRVDSMKIPTENAVAKVTNPSWAVPPKVLLVEDDAISLRLSSKLLQIFGCKFDVATDGLVAVNKMNLDRYDLVLMVCHSLTNWEYSWIVTSLFLYC
jgi:CheY-like chemotaxis protein